MQTCSEVGFTFQQLLFVYHYSPVSNFCHWTNRHIPHETANIEAICILQIGFFLNRAGLRLGPRPGPSKNPTFLQHVMHLSAAIPGVLPRGTPGLWHNDINQSPYPRAIIFSQSLPLSLPPGRHWLGTSVLIEQQLFSEANNQEHYSRKQPNFN